MKPTKQAKEDDCWSACLASLLEIPLELVPDFYHGNDNDEQVVATQKWLKKLGYTIIELPLVAGETPPWGPMKIPAWCILTVKSPRYGYHAVVGRVKDHKVQIAFDPRLEILDHGDETIVSIAFLVQAINDKKPK
jgi:hypothetical protein